MALDLNRLRNVARTSGAANNPLASSDSAVTEQGARSATRDEAILGIIAILAIGSGIYWWRYVVVPLGATFAIGMFIAALKDSTFESSKKWGVGIVGSCIIAVLSVYLWNHRWPGVSVRPSAEASNAQPYAEAKWTCKGDVNIREGDGTYSPGRGSLSPKKFTQGCDGRVWVRIGSEATVVQSNGIRKIWVRIWTQNGEGWVNGDLVSYSPRN